MAAIAGLILASTAALADDKPAEPKSPMPDWDTYTCGWFLDDGAKLADGKGSLANIDSAMRLNMTMAFATGYAQKRLDQAGIDGVINDASIRAIGRQIAADCKASLNTPLFDVMRATINRVEFN